MAARKYPSRWVFLGLVFSHQFFIAGVIFGWTPLQTVLEEMGVFSSLCDHGDKTCDASSTRLSLVFTIAAALLTASGVVLGPAMDRWGPRVVRLISAAVFIVGTLLLGFAGPESLLWFPGYSCIAFGGGGLQLSAFHISMLFPGHESVVVSLMTGVFSASAYIFLFFKLLYENEGWSLESMFLYYSIAGVACFASSWCWPDTSFSSPDDLKPNRPKGSRGSRWSAAWSAANSRPGSHSGSRRASARHSTRESSDANAPGGLHGAAPINSSGTFPAPPHPQDTEEMLHEHLLRTSSLENVDVETLDFDRGDALLCTDLSGLSVWRQLASFEAWGLILYFSLQLNISNFFLTSIADQLKSHHDDHGTYIGLFGIIYPLGFIATPLAGFLQDRYHLVVVFCYVNVINLASQLLLLVPSLEVQILTFILYAAGRQCIFSLFFASLGRMFGFDTFGVLSGVGNAFSAALTFAVTPLYHYCQQNLDHHYTGVNIVLASIIGAQFLYAIIVYQRFRSWRDGKLYLRS